METASLLLAAGIILVIALGLWLYLHFRKQSGASPAAPARPVPAQETAQAPDEKQAATNSNGAVVEPTAQGVSMQESPAAGQKSSSLKPEQLAQDIQARSPFQRLSLTNDYAGVTVKWNLRYNRLTPDDRPGHYLVWFAAGTGTLFIPLTVVCSFDLNAHPELKTWKQGETIMVIGKIKKIDEMTVYFDDAVIAGE